MAAGYAWGQAVNPAANPIQDAIEKKNYAEAIKLLKPLADQGDPQAQSLLGGLYADGLGTKANVPTAIELWNPMTCIPFSGGFLPETNVASTSFPLR